VDTSHVPFVDVEYAVYAPNFRLLEVAVERESVTGLALVHEARHSTEAEAGKALVLVVGLEDVAHLPNRI